MQTLATRLGVNTDYAIKAFEDPLHYLHQEGKLPVNLTPGNNRFKRPEDRERLRRDSISRACAVTWLTWASRSVAPSRFPREWSWGIWKRFSRWTCTRGLRCTSADAGIPATTQQDLNGGRVAVAYGRDATDVAIYSQFGDPVESLQMGVTVGRLPGPPW